MKDAITIRYVKFCKVQSNDIFKQFILIPWKSYCLFALKWRSNTGNQCLGLY